jgi:DNA-binding transcriptional MocR family regulator
MTNWLPDLSTGSGPIYVRLADHIETAIANGTLPPGTKLPPQRNIAFDLGVTIGTISRAYALIHERGLVSGEVGRGTYVNDSHTPGPTTATMAAAPASLGGTRDDAVNDGQLRFNTTAAPDVGQSRSIEQHIASIARDKGIEVAGYARTFPADWFVAGASWLAQNGFRPNPENVVPTLGAHAAVMSVIATMTSPGDRIVFEQVTYSQLSRSAVLAGRRVVLVLMSSGQNPTCATLPESRRRAIADIAHRNNVWIIEDNLYGAMSRDDIPLIAEFAPDLTFLVGGLSKSVAAGVRGGWVACPANFAPRIRIAHKMMTGGLPYLMAELCSRLVNSGDAHDIGARTLLEINRREAIAREMLTGFEFNALPDIPFLWLKLPEPWLSGTFRSAAMKEGVLIDDEDEFKAGRSDKVFHRVRVSFSAPATHADLRRGFGVLRHLLDNGSAGYDSPA